MRALQRKCGCGGATQSGGSCGGCAAKKTKVQRSAQNGWTPQRVPSIVNDVLGMSGRPLDSGTRSLMESRFGHDFSNVRVHADGAAASSARAIGALAYTVGSHVVFGDGRFAPSSRDGQRLLAHELTHVVQQRSAPITLGTRMEISDPGDAAEREAEVVANQFHTASPLPPIGGAPPVLHRLGDVTRRPPGLSCPLPPGLPANITDTFTFTHGDAGLNGLQKTQIGSFIGRWRRAGGTAPVRVDGFASTDGSQELNWRLSCDRAIAVKNELTSPTTAGVVGIPASSITFFAQGESVDASATALEPNRRATIDTTAFLTPPAPTCSTTPPPCPVGGAAPQLRNPGIASGSQCRGACGPDCPPTCSAPRVVTLCVTDAAGVCHWECTYNNTITCGSHLGCRVHDACYDACAAAGERRLCPLGTCHCGCDGGCLGTHGVTNCNSWRTGGGPFDSMLNFSDPAAAPAGPFPGACGP